MQCQRFSCIQTLRINLYGMQRSVHHKFLGFLLFIMMSVSLTANCQPNANLNWPALTKETKPWSRWWWEGSAVNNKDLTALMEKYHAAGLGGLEITPIYGVRGAERQFISYLSPQWMQVLTHTLQEGRRLDLGIDMANATGWPFGGPWVTATDASKDIQYKVYHLRGRERLGENITYMQEPLVRSDGKKVDISTLKEPITANENLQELALDQVKFAKPLPLVALVAYSNSGQVVDITAKADQNGKLDWVAPAGDWTLYALFQGWHGKMVERAAPGGEGYVIDHFSGVALDHYLNRFDQAFKGQDIHSLRSFFNDSYEVDDARGQANWSPGLFAAFKKQHGYDLHGKLPALFGKDSADINSRVICDYRSTIAEMLLDSFTRPWHAWAKRKGMLIRNQSHGSPANILDLYAAIDIPETEGTDILRFKFATSAAHVTGKKLASSESATWLDDHFLSSLGNVKSAIDKYFAGGVNHIFYHGISYSPQEAKWPGWLFYAAVHFTPENPEWNNFSALNNYIARCQSFLQAGKPDNDILVYYPIYDRFSDPGNVMLRHFDGMEREFTNTVFKANAERMLERGYTFDFISDRQIQQLTTANGKIVTGGVAYQTILISDSHVMPLETFRHLVKLAGNGAKVIVHKSLPADVPGYGQLAQRRKAFQQLVDQLHFTATKQASVQQAAIGKGSITIGANLDELLAFTGIRREQMADEHLLFERRKTNNGYTYFIVNKSDKPVSGYVPVAVKAAAAALFNPMDSTSGMAGMQPAADGNTTLYVQLLPEESCILQTYDQPAKGVAYAYYEPAGKPVAINGSWTLTFTDGGPSLPPKTSLPDAVLWTGLPGDDMQNFSGTATYAVTFTAPAGKGDWLLDLGKVHESAAVYLNGRKLAVLLGPVYQVKILAPLLQHLNTLEIKVSNLMANRIIDMDKRHEDYKIFYNTNFPAHARVNANEKGLFDASKWKPLPSGLAGPVTLTAIEHK